jgi:gliding motility-associated-like protein
MSRAFLFCLLLICVEGIHAQSKCPVNIGFEKGTFDGWECATGMIGNEDGKITLTTSSPVYNRHTLNRNTEPQLLDRYGNFPVVAPNGSDYAIRLGNDQVRSQAEQVSYTFTIPADQNNYSIVYYYAVVFQDRGHPSTQQPKFTAKVYDVNQDSYIKCSSVDYTASANLPGFKISPIRDSVPIYYKDWTPVTMKLSGLAGHTIRLEFTTNDCSPGGHFGYAYIDISQNCTSPISGNVLCASSEQLTLTAPYGFASYKWFNEDFSKELGTENRLIIKPVPQPNTKYAVEVIPYIDQQCMDTIYTSAIFSPDPLDLRVKPQVSACISTGMNLTDLSITAGSTPNLSFSYFTDPELTKYVAVPKNIPKSGDYFVQAENDAGCTLAKQISVNIEPLPEFEISDPPAVYRPATIDLAKTIISSVSPYNYDYWLDSPVTKEITSPHFIDKTGKYYVVAHNQVVPDCAVTQGVKVKILDPVIKAPNVFTPNGDGINDTWLIAQLAYYPECLLEVYTRSGRLLWRSDPGYTKPWDGKSQGKNLPVDTYYYVIKLNDELPNVGGSVTIIR